MRVNPTETSRARPGLLIVLIAVAVVVLTLWVREGDTGPLHRVRVGFQAVTAPIAAGGEFVSRPVRGFFAWASDLGVSRSQLEQLRSQNVSLRARVAELEEARLENERLTGLLDITKPAEVASVGARVIGRPASSWEGVITIDRGTADGVGPGMPVVGARGLLGQTVEVGPRSAKVRLITDQRSGVAALVQRNRAEGIVRGSIDGRLTMDFVSAETTISAGDVVITSGMGGVYPKGLVIGEVSAVRREENQLYQFVRVEPAGDLTGLEEVIVLVGQPAIASPEGEGE